jgi:hypothetical protein
VYHYKLTDGRQINTGYGRLSRALGYVMEISPGRWVARVGDLNSGILSLGLAKKAAVELHRRKDKGEPLDWITELNRQMAAEIDRLSVMVSLTDDGRYHVKLRWGSDFRAEFPRSELPEDDAAYTLWDWGYRGTFSLRWPDGSVATYVKANKRPGTKQTAVALKEDHHGPTPGAIVAPFSGKVNCSCRLANR